LKSITILFASDEREEHAAFAEFVKENGLPYRILYPDSVSKIDAIITNEKVDIIITDLRFQNGGFADWLFLWPMPFILLADYKEAARIDEIIKDEACDFLIRDANGKHLPLLPIMIRKVLNQRESLNRQNMHLQISERRYLDLVQALPDIVYTVDDAGYFTFINDSVENLGYKPMDLIGKHFHTIVDPSDVPKVSRRYVLKDFEGKSTGPDNAPKLFDERRTGTRRTRDLEVKLRPNDKPMTGIMKIGSIISYGEVSSVGFASAGLDSESMGSAASSATSPQGNRPRNSSGNPSARRRSSSRKSITASRTISRSYPACSISRATTSRTPTISSSSSTAICRSSPWPSSMSSSISPTV